MLGGNRSSENRTLSHSGSSTAPPRLLLYQHNRRELLLTGQAGSDSLPPHVVCTLVISCVGTIRLKPDLRLSSICFQSVRHSSSNAGSASVVSSPCFLLLPLHLYIPSGFPSLRAFVRASSPAPLHGSLPFSPRRCLSSPVPHLTLLCFCLRLQVC